MALSAARLCIPLLAAIVCFAYAAADAEIPQYGCQGETSEPSGGLDDFVENSIVNDPKFDPLTNFTLSEYEYELMSVSREEKYLVDGVVMDGLRFVLFTYLSLSRTHTQNRSGASISAVLAGAGIMEHFDPSQNSFSVSSVATGTGRGEKDGESESEN